MSSDQERYEHKQYEEQQRWEALCGRCGACCGVFEGDPCEHLRKDHLNKYYCSIYDNRYGYHKTINGNIINCVPIRKILHGSWPGDHCCGYKKDLKKITHRT